MLSKEEFINECAIHFPPMGRDKNTMGRVWDAIFKFKENEYLTVAMLDEIALEDMKSFCRTIDVPHGIVTNGTEHVFVLPGEKIKEKHSKYNKDAFLTEKEKLWNEIVRRDPLLDYLTPSEKEEYINKNKERFGDVLTYEDGLSSQHAYIPWTIEDLPKQYHEELSKGTIPESFKEEFIDLIPEHLYAEHADLLNKNFIPLPIHSAICPQVFKKITRHDKLKAIKEKLLIRLVERLQESKPPGYEEMYEDIIAGHLSDDNLERLILDNRDMFKRDVNVYKRIIREEL